MKGASIACASVGPVVAPVPARAASEYVVVSPADSLPLLASSRCSLIPPQNEPQASQGRPSSSKATFGSISVDAD